MNIWQVGLSEFARFKDLYSIKLELLLEFYTKYFDHNRLNSPYSTMIHPFHDYSSGARGEYLPPTQLPIQVQLIGESQVSEATRGIRRYHAQQAGQSWYYIISQCKVFLGLSLLTF